MTDQTQSDEARGASYEYPIRLANSFEDVLVQEPTHSPTVSVGEFAEVVMRTACTLLQARGGAGKSYTATRVCEALRSRGHWAVVVSATSISARMTSDWALDDWLELAGETSERQLADAGIPGLIVVDGLNEIDRSSGDRLLETIDPVAAVNPQVSFLVTDRLTRRTTASPFWKYAALGPVPDDVVRRVAGVQPTETLSIPFYLSRHASGTAASEILRESIERFVDPTLLPLIAQAAYESYAQHQRRAIDRDLTTSLIGSDVWQSLLEANEIVEVAQPRRDSQGSDTFQFVHHLLHDFLAGVHLAGNPSLWNEVGFDVVTFDASSFDGLALALARIDSESNAESLVQRIYDWNFYAAAYVLEENRSADSHVSQALRTAVLGALGEKKFDQIAPTAQRAADALRVQESALAITLLSANDRHDLIAAIVDCSPSNPPTWFDNWLDLFARADGSPASETDLETVRSDHPITGWGAANALRRLAVSPEGQGFLRQILLDDEVPVFRWRAAHALGPHSSPENLRALVEALEGESEESWVAYGALRAEFEQVLGMHADARGTALKELATQVSERLAPRRKLRAETMRCLDVDPMPSDWHRDIEPILDALWDSADARGAAELVALAARLRDRKETARVN